MSDDDKYYSLSNDMDDLRFGLGAKDKTIAGAKIFGKSIFNVGKFVFTSAIPAATDHLEREAEKKKNSK